MAALKQLNGAYYQLPQDFPVQNESIRSNFSSSQPLPIHFCKSRKHFQSVLENAIQTSIFPKTFFQGMPNGYVFVDIRKLEGRTNTQPWK